MIYDIIAIIIIEVIISLRWRRHIHTALKMLLTWLLRYVVTPLRWLRP